MKELMIDESTVIELYRKKLDDLEHRDVVNMDIYSNYRIEVPVQENDTQKNILNDYVYGTKRTVKNAKRN